MLNHVFRLEAQKLINPLFDRCDSLSCFLENLRSLQLFSDHVIHHGFEALVEALIQYKTIIGDYNVTSAEDSGSYRVFGTGTNSEGNQSAVGIFYVIPQNEDTPLTANRNHITTFFDCAQQHYGIEQHAGTLLLFSNGPSLHDRTTEQFIEMQGLTDAVILYMRDDIAALIDGDVEFWKFFKEEMRHESEPLLVKKLRKFQKQAVKSCRGEKRGKIILPTGTGKTLIEAGLMEAAIRDWRRGKPPVCVICSPRIILTYQHINEISEYLTSRNIEAAYINLNSGAYDDRDAKRSMMRQGVEVRSISSTTCPEALDKKYNECCANRLPLVIGATYQSFPKLLKTEISVTLKIADEAHNIVPHVGRFSEQAKRDYHKVQSTQSIFVTATPATSPHNENDPDVGFGMQNEKVFGKVLFTQTPKMMIEAGEIVPPYIHAVEITSGTIKKHNIKIEIADCEDIENSEIDAIVIMESFEELRRTHYRYSSSPDKIGTKLLVTFKGQQSFHHFFNRENTMVRRWAEKNNVMLVGMTSESGAYIDGERFFANNTKYKDEFLKYLDEADDECQIIIGHIDMIGEGINIPTLLGVLPLRDLGTIKASQTLGRSMRLFGRDRADFYSGKTEACDRNNMVKPYCWVVVPYYSWDHQGGSDRIVNIARKMKSDLGYNPVEVAAGGDGDGRVEQFQKDSRMPTDEVDSLDICHRVDNPEFIERKENEKDIMRKDPKEFRKMVKYIAT